MKKVLAVASGGGHWVELLRLMPAFDACEVAFVTTVEGNRNAVKNYPCFIITEASRWHKMKLLIAAIQLLSIIVRFRPDVVVSTGAAPGLLAVRIGKLFGSKTIWLDSLANAEEISMSGRLAGPYVDLWLTQWKEIESAQGPYYRGSVL